MSAAVLVEALLMTFVLLAPTMMVAVLVSGVSRRTSAEPARVTVDALDGAEVVPLRTAA
jgi:hypothetical protein